MSQPIPLTKKPRSLSLNHAQGHGASASATGLLTPTGTPPHAEHHVESKLLQLLAHLDSGTHSFCRDERETPEERRMSFGSMGGDVFPTPPSSRRASFLSSLSLTRPFGFTPSTPSSAVGTPLSGSHPPEFHDHAQAHAHAHPQLPSISSSPEDVRPPLDRTGAQSSPNLLLQSKRAEEGALPTTLNRAKTTSHLPVKQSGFVASGSGLANGGVGHGSGAGGGGEERRHFDPSREPKLLGLL